jgi:hypothetical protein
MIDAKQPEAIGAIRMQAQCARCHQPKDGELLGAFRYPLQRDEAASARQVQQTNRLRVQRR